MTVYRLDAKAQLSATRTTRSGFGAGVNAHTHDGAVTQVDASDAFGRGFEALEVLGQLDADGVVQKQRLAVDHGVSAVVIGQQAALQGRETVFYASQGDVLDGVFERLESDGFFGHD